MRGKLYYEIVTAASDCFGPTAEKIIYRLITSHLNIKPEEITPKDIPALLVWAKLVMSLYTDKQHTIDRFTDNVRSLESKSTEETFNIYDTNS